MALGQFGPWLADRYGADLAKRFAQDPEGNLYRDNALYAQRGLWDTGEDNTIGITGWGNLGDFDESRRTLPTAPLSGNPEFLTLPNDPRTPQGREFLFQRGVQPADLDAWLASNAGSLVTNADGSVKVPLSASAGLNTIDPTTQAQREGDRGFGKFAAKGLPFILAAMGLPALLPGGSSLLGSALSSLGGELGAGAGSAGSSLEALAGGAAGGAGAGAGAASTGLEAALAAGNAEALGIQGLLGGELGAGLGSAGSSIEALGGGGAAGGDLLAELGSGGAEFFGSPAIGEGAGTLGGAVPGFSMPVPSSVPTFSEVYGTPPVSGDLTQFGQGLATTASNVGTVASALNKAFKTNLNDADTALIGKLLGGGLGLAGSLIGGDKQGDAFSSLQNNLLGLGAPYRQSLAGLEANPMGYIQGPEVQGAVQQGTNNLARSLSAKTGNPFDNATALQELQNYATTANLGQLNQRRNFLLGAGQMGLGGATQAGFQAAGQEGQGTSNALNALGSTIRSVFNEDPYEKLRSILKDISGPR